ncbi:SCO6745 family protein [Actinoplanes sp. URMC 104]|uniref:SCO6745 family protein n=1 Tax=Actinoplanes sp. URMC 104 TaxID=3423409 RepID=UPI003F1AA1A4
MTEPTVARRLWALFEPLHAVTYFAPQAAAAAFADAGLTGFWRGYFAGRSAALGPVGPEPVTAAFFGFAPAMVARALPDVWSRISPSAAIAARRAGASAALNDLFTEPPASPDRPRDQAPRTAPATALLEPADQAADPLETAGQTADPLQTAGQGPDPIQTAGQGPDPIQTAGQGPDPIQTAGQTADPLQTAGQAADLLQTVGEAAELLEQAARAAELPGRVLAAAHAGLPWPEEPVARLWHAATVLREHRGDGHVAALLTAGVDGCESLVWRVSLDGGRLREVTQPARGWTDEQWRDAGRRLRERGWIDADGTATAAGRDAYAQVEELTDRLAAGPWRRLGGAATQRCARLLTPLAERAWRVVPDDNPIPLRRG